MKSAVSILFLIFLAVECRKVVQINKNANIDFINMETGGVRQPPVQPQPKAPAAAPTNKPPTPTPVAKPAPTPTPVAKPAPTPTPITVKPPQPPQTPNQIKPVPVNPKPVANPATTPGPGSVKSLINYYDSQGKASPIRPYSYSQAVKQG